MCFSIFPSAGTWEGSPSPSQSRDSGLFRERTPLAKVTPRAPFCIHKKITCSLKIGAAPRLAGQEVNLLITLLGSQAKGKEPLRDHSVGREDRGGGNSVQGLFCPYMQRNRQGQAGRLRLVTLRGFGFAFGN